MSFVGLVWHCLAVTATYEAHSWLPPVAGASLVELYTGLAYEGPALVPKLKKQLAACLEADGFTSVQDAIGYDHRK